MIILFSLTNPIQAGWLDKNLDKLKKAKDLLNSAPKINQLKKKRMIKNQKNLQRKHLRINQKKLIL